MVSNQVVTGVNIWSLAVMMLGPAVITGAVSIILSQLQLKTRIYELKGESEYKARENLFKSYQEKLRSIKESNASFNEGLGKTLGILGTLEDEGEKIKLLRMQLKLLKFCKELIVDSINDFEEELKKSKLFTGKVEERMKFAKKVLSADLENISDPALEGVVMDYYKVMNLLDIFEGTLLEKKRDELFSKYLT